MKKIRLLALFCLFIVLLPTAASAQDWILEDSGATTHTLYSVYPANQHLVIAVGATLSKNSGLIIKSVNGGDNWEVIEQQPQATLGVCGWNENDMVIVGEWEKKGTKPVGSGIQTSSNGGDSWDWVLSPVEATLWDVYCVGSGKGYAVGKSGTVIKTTDYGHSWIELDSGATSTLYGVYFVDDQNGYVVGGGGSILKTTDGVNFKNLGPIKSDISGVAITFRSVSCTDADTCWVVGDNEIIYHTEDGGDTWEKYDTGPLVFTMKGVNFVDEDLGWVVGQQGIRHTEDGGKTWTTDGTEISTSTGAVPVTWIWDVQFVNAPYIIGWAVGSSEYDNDGLILRYSAPQRISDMIDAPASGWAEPAEPIVAQEEEEAASVCSELTTACEPGYSPVYEYDGEGCTVGYDCELEEGDASVGANLVYEDGAGGWVRANLLFILPVAIAVCAGVVFVLVRKKK